MPADVFEYSGNNPPGLDVLSKHETVIWKHPQHGWLRADKNGAFTPLDESAVQRLQGTAPKPAVTSEPAVGATGSTTPDFRGRSTTTEAWDEVKRAKAEKENQATLDKAKFTPQVGPDPMAGLGIVERAKVQELVRGGMSQAEAVKKVKPPAAATQAEGLK